MIPKATQRVQENILLLKKLRLRLKKSLRRLKIKEDMLIIKEQRSVLNIKSYALAYYNDLGTSLGKGGSSVIYPAVLYGAIGCGGETSKYVIVSVLIIIIAM